MNFSKKQILTVTGIVFAALLFNRILQNPALLTGMGNALMTLFAPFIVGGAIAFILNIPMQTIERRLFPHNKKLDKLRRPLAWLLTVLLLILLISLIIGFVIPQLIETLQTVSRQALQMVQSAGQLLDWLPEQTADALPDLEQTLQDLGFNISSLSSKLAQMLQNIGDIVISGFDILGNIVSVLVTLFVGFFFSIYLLFSKETLARQGKQLCYALLKAERADKLVAILRLTQKTFKNFITGQVIEACILALMFFVSMLILRLPYATLISLVIGVTALVPIFGAFIGCAFGILLIVITSPLQALGFLVLFLILQQIEGNLIYPKVVGGKVGLPAIWVLLAITLGGSLFGIIGMLVFIPLCSVCYTLLAGFVKHRLELRQIPPDKWQD